MIRQMRKLNRKERKQQNYLVIAFFPRHLVSNSNEALQKFARQNLFQLNIIFFLSNWQLLKRGKSFFLYIVNELNFLQPKLRENVLNLELCLESFDFNIFPCLPINTNCVYRTVKNVISLTILLFFESIFI